MGYTFKEITGREPFMLMFPNGGVRYYDTVDEAVLEGRMLERMGARLNLNPDRDVEKYPNAFKELVAAANKIYAECEGLIDRFEDARDMAAELKATRKEW